MIKFNYLPILVYCTFLFSCSSNEGEDPILGTWYGSVTQPNFGTIEINLQIDDLKIDEVSGQLNSEVTDISICDNNFFVCEKGTCAATWTFKSKSGSNYSFLETSLPGSLCGDGNISAILQNNDQIAFTWTDVTNPSNKSSGTLTRQ